MSLKPEGQWRGIAKKSESGEKPQRRFGMGRGRILGDIVGPAVDLSDWEAEAEEGPQK